MQAAGAQAYLVNTGWNGTGKRISIKDTRAIIHAILNGSLDNAETFTLPMFNLAIPTELPGVDTKILDPRNTYDLPRNSGNKKAETLAKLFIDNFDKYTDTPAGAALVAAGRKLNYLKLENIYPVSIEAKREAPSPPVYLPFFLSCPAPALPAQERGEWKARPCSLVPSSSIPLRLSTIRCTIASPIPCR